MKDDPEIVKQLRLEEQQNSDSSSILVSNKKYSTNQLPKDFSKNQDIPITYKQLLDNANILIQSVTPEGKFLYVNKKWKNVLGYSNDELLNLSVWDIIREDHQKTCQSVLSELLTGKDFVSVETVFLKKSGESVYVKGNVNITKNKDGNVSTIGFFRDITLEKQVNEDYEFLFNESCEALFIQDIKTGKIIDVNKKMCELYGYSYDEAITLSVENLSSGKHPYTQKMAQLRAKRTATEGPQTFKWHAKHKNGALFWVEVTLKLVELRGETFFLTSVRDITNRIRIEQKLKDTVKKFQLITTSAADAIIMMDPKGNVNYWNPSAEKIFGYKKSEIMGKNLHEFIAHPSYLEQFYSAFQHFQETGEGNAIDKTVELKGIRKNGEKFPVELSLSAVNADDGRHAIAILRDISKRKKDDEKLQIFSEAVKQNPASIVITDSKGNIEYVNPQFESLTGYSLEEVKGKNPRVLKSGKQSSDFYKELWGSITNGETWQGEFHNKKKDGTLYWEEASISPIKDTNEKITHYIAIKENTTEKKQMISDLHIKENAIMSSINGMMLIDLEGAIVFANNAFLDMWNIDSEEDILGKPAMGFWKKPGLYLDIMDKAVQGEGWFGEIEARSPEKGELFLQLSANLVLDEKDEPAFIMNSFVDITEQKKLEEEFKKFKTISDKAAYGSLTHDKKGVITYANSAFALIHGRSVEDLIGSHISVLWDESDEEKMLDIHDEIETHQDLKAKEIVHKHKDGHDIPLLMSSTFIPASNDDQSFYAETFVDISELKEAQQKVQQHVDEVEMMNTELNVAREQLATLNQDLEKRVEERTAEVERLLNQKNGFINQLGHDLRTPLTPMLGLLPLLKKRINDEKGLTYISMIDKNIRFMKDLVNKTITFAKLNSDKVEFTYTQMNLLDFLRQIQQQLQNLLNNKKTQLDINVDPSVVVFADETRLSEVFHNLISNAIKYAKKETQIRIEITAEISEDTVVIRVIDNGIGMTAEQIDHVFEEFYKADDARTDVDSHGLGLNICKRIIEKHGGRIWVESEGSGKGSHFIFTLHITDGSWNTQHEKQEKEMNDEENISSPNTE
jgi:PAS domain S-box-containing protein